MTKAFEDERARYERQIEFLRAELEELRTSQSPRQTRFRRQGDDESHASEFENTKSLKVQIPPFNGKNDPEAYLNWERKVERIFDLHNYSELDKVKMASMEFSDYASSWWDQLCYARRRDHEEPIDRKSVV